jgi:AcrR family transcriptional regulator
MENTTARTLSGAEITSETPHANRPKLRGRPKKEHAPVIDTDILKIATEIFAEKGYASTSMEAIATKVGITKRTLYIRYPDKMSLYKKITEQIIRNAGVPDPMSFPDMRTCLMHHTENYFIIASDPTMRVLRSLGTSELIGVPELAQIAEEMTRDVGIIPIAKTIKETAAKDGLKVSDPEFLAASILDLARGHYDRVQVLKLRNDFASFKFAAERIVNLLLAQILSENSENAPQR